MDAVTYPDPAVERFVNEHFVPIKVNIARPGAMKDFTRTVRPVWAPLFVFLDPSGSELRRYTGWLPPNAFLAELRFVLGMHGIIRRQFAEALQRFRSIASEHPDLPIAAEALFWAGAAAYKSGNKDYGALRSTWAELRERYPGSTWAARADVWDMAGSGEHT